MRDLSRLFKPFMRHRANLISRTNERTTNKERTNGQPENIMSSPTLLGVEAIKRRRSHLFSFPYSDGHKCTITRTSEQPSYDYRSKNPQRRNSLLIFETQLAVCFKSHRTSIAWIVYATPTCFNIYHSLESSISKGGWFGGLQGAPEAEQFCFFESQRLFQSSHTFSKSCAFCPAAWSPRSSRAWFHHWTAATSPVAAANLDIPLGVWFILTYSSTPPPSTRISLCCQPMAVHHYTWLRCTVQ